MKEKIVTEIMRQLAVEQMKKYLESKDCVEAWCNLNLLGDPLELYTKQIEVNHGKAVKRS